MCIRDRKYIQNYAVKELLLAGSDVNTVDNNRYTALMWAVGHCYGNGYLVNKLLKAGANVNAVGKNGTTALMLALGSPALVANEWVTPSIFPCYNIEVVTLFLNAGANVNAVDNLQM